MDDLRRRFASLDRMQPPDLWSEIGLRAAALPAAGQGTDMVGPDRLDARRPMLVRLAVAVLLIALLAGIAAVGARLLERTSVLQPDPSHQIAVTTQPAPSPGVTLLPSPSPRLGLIAYTVTKELVPGQGRCIHGRLIDCSVNRLWVANADGTDQRELMPGGFDDQVVIAWSPDGEQLLYRDGSTGNLTLTDVHGAAAEQIQDDTFCPEENCALLDYFAFSPDGRRLAYGIEFGDGRSVIGFLDLETRVPSVLATTATANPSGPCLTAAHEGVIDSPRWSPDGSRLVFARQIIGPRNEAGMCQTELYIVNADGTGLRLLVGRELWPLDGHWSPDGELIVFRSERVIPDLDPDALPVNVDLYTIRPDGSDLSRLTEDGMSLLPRWTADGRIAFIKWLTPEEYQLWVMDADGGNQTQVEATTFADLTAVHCMQCPFAPSGGGTDALWQPLP